MPIDKTVLVTGAASGIGLATVRALLAADVAVIAIDRDETRLDPVTPAGRLHVEMLDVSDETAIVPAISRGIAALGELGGVVSAAGIGRDVAAAQTGAQLFRDILDVNLVGAFLIAREAAARMRRRAAARS